MTRRRPYVSLHQSAEAGRPDAEKVKAAKARPEDFAIGDAVTVALAGHASRPTLKAKAVVLDTRENWLCRQVRVEIEGVERWVVADRVKQGG